MPEGHQRGDGCVPVIWVDDGVLPARQGAVLLLHRTEPAGSTLADLDLVALAPGRRPRHLADAWPEA